MKWLGQYVQSFTARFRSDVYLEDISSGTIVSGGHLGLDSNDKIVKAVDGGGDLTSIVAGAGMTGTSLTGPTPTLNVIGGGGITANANDVAVRAAQTTITSIYNAGLKIGNGSSADSIAFDVDEKIGFAVSGDEQVALYDGALLPRVTNNVDLGSEDLRWKYIYAAGTVYSTEGFSGNLTGNASGSSGTVTSIGNLTGEVTSTNRATVIAGDVVDEANLKCSNGPTNGHFLSAQSGNTGGLTWAAIPTLNQNTTGLAGTATALATSRNFQADLASTSAVGFTGAANCTLGVTGTLAVGNGGTGVTGITALKNLLDDETWTFANDITGTLATTNQPNITDLGGVDSIGTAATNLVIHNDETMWWSTAASKPVLRLTNYHNGSSGPLIRFTSDRTGGTGTTAGQSGDSLGAMLFEGHNDAGEDATYATMGMEIQDPADGAESARFRVSLMSHGAAATNDSTGLLLSGGSEDNEVDVTIGSGANSVVTIPGNLTITGGITTSRQLTHHTIVDDIDATDVVYISLGEIDAENTTNSNKNLPLLAPVAGKLLKVFVRTTADTSGVNLTFKLYTRTVSQSTNGAAAVVGAQTSAGPTNKTMVTYDFTTGLDSGVGSETNAIAAGDKVLLSVESSGATSNQNIFISCLWEWDLS